MAKPPLAQKSWISLLSFLPFALRSKETALNGPEEPATLVNELGTFVIDGSPAVPSGSEPPPGTVHPIGVCQEGAGPRTRS